MKVASIEPMLNLVALSRRRCVSSSIADSRRLFVEDSDEKRSIESPRDNESVGEFADEAEKV